MSETEVKVRGGGGDVSPLEAFASDEGGSSSSVAPASDGGDTSPRGGRSNRPGGGESPDPEEAVQMAAQPAQKPLLLSAVDWIVELLADLWEWLNSA